LARQNKLVYVADSHWMMRTLFKLASDAKSFARHCPTARRFDKVVAGSDQVSR
jgi:hypothetical protein